MKKYTVCYTEDGRRKTCCEYSKDKVQVMLDYGSDCGLSNIKVYPRDLLRHFEIPALRDLEQQLLNTMHTECRRLYRLARKAGNHGVKQQTINAILEEARRLAECGGMQPWQLLQDNATWEYAFH